MEAEMKQANPDPAKFWKNVGVIGKQGCKMCCLTHRAYSMLQEYWEQEE